MKKCLLATGLILMITGLWAQRSILIKNVHIIDVEKGSLIKNADVLIKGTLITQINTGKNKKVIAADSTINGTGLFLMPGLWDMHTHTWNEAQIFPLLIANGVTGIRGMFDDMNTIKRWRDKMNSGQLTGPMFKVSGPIVDGPKPIWPGSVAIKDTLEARKAVDSIKNKLHTDFIKVYSLLSREAYFAIADEARKQKISFAGHVPNVVTVLEAARAGQKSQEHLYGFLEAASDSAAYIMQVAQGKITDSSFKGAKRKAFILKTYNPKKLAALLQEIKTTDSWICPTLTVNRGIAWMNDSTLLNNPRMQYLGTFYKNFWDPTKDFRFKTWTAETFDLYKKEFEIKLQIVKAMQDNGIGLLAGTDYPNPHCYPGFGIHDELEWMVKAGLTPAQALRTATLNPAIYFTLQNTLGTVAQGKMASLLLLNANPLENISNTQKINAVLLNGIFFSRADLDNMLEKVKKMVTN
jgi:imidazolonepropionase-like amidohydrolase